MPLVNKQPFKPNPIPDNLGPDDEVFYHELTNEIFTSHDAFFDRFLFCNSLVWTCSRTGKSGLTYKEALDSEQQEEVPKKKKKGKRAAAEEPNSDGTEPVKKKKKKYPYDPKKYSMPVPEGFDPSLLTPTGKIDGRKLKSKKNKLLAEELLLHTQSQSPATTGSPGKRGRHKKKEDESRKKEEEAKRKEEEAKRKAQMQAELAKERELEAKRKKEAAALAKQLERQKKEEERKKATAFLQNWEKKCEDLQRDDLKILPQPTPVDCDIPEKLFGDSIFIMEAAYNFHDLYNFNEIYPEGMDFDVLEDILFDKQEEGALGTFLKFLLKVIFHMQPTREGYGLDDDLTQKLNTENTNPKQDAPKTGRVKAENGTDGDHEHETNGVEMDGDDDENDENEDKDVNMNDLIGSAIKAAQEVKKSFSKPLPEMEITPSNVTEILRLHLLQSGSFPKGRTIYNGWYSSREDPGLWLCMQEPDLIKKLGEVSVYDLEIEDRIKILHTLIYQLLSFIKTRAYMDMASEQLTELRKAYRKEAAEFARWDRENCLKRMQPPKKKNDTTTSGTEKTNGHGDHQDTGKSDGGHDNNNGTSPGDEGDLDGETHHIKKESNNNDTAKPDTVYQNGNSEGSVGDNGETTNHDEKNNDETEESYEELERAYQQNTVDYEDYQRERSIRLEQLNATLLDLRINLRNNQAVYAIHPIGRDRAYRRYWLFQSLPGLFVEQDDEFVGRCLDNPTPLESQYKKLFDKENPLRHSNDLIRVSDITDYCTGDETTCHIHGQNRPKGWWFFHQPESIESLIASLNKRGYRESELRDVLSAESSIIKPRVGECPSYKLNKHIPEPVGIRRSRRLKTKGSKRWGTKHQKEQQQQQQQQ